MELKGVFFISTVGSVRLKLGEYRCTDEPDGSEVVLVVVEREVEGDIRVLSGGVDKGVGGVLGEGREVVGCEDYWE